MTKATAIAFNGNWLGLVSVQHGGVQADAENYILIIGGEEKDTGLGLAF